jgi:hypothetical protein
MVGDLGGLRDPQDGDYGLEDLLHDDGAEDLEARGAVAGRDLCRVVDAVAEEPGRVGEVEELEKEGGEPVCGDWGEDGEERVGEGGEEGGRGGIVYWVGVEERVGWRCRCERCLCGGVVVHDRVVPLTQPPATDDMSRALIT